MDQPYPLVSCLCTSKPSRWGNLQRAILDFTRQEYGRKELVIVVGEPDYCATVESFLTHLSTEQDLSQVKLFQRNNSRTAQDCYLHALCQARGDYITFWDDENQNLPGRLAEQVARQVKFPDSLTAFTQGLYYFYDTREVFVVNFEQPQAPTSERCCVNTLMSPRDILPPLDGTIRANPIGMLADGLSNRYARKLILIHSVPFGHLIGVTGDNLRKYDTHRRLATQLPGCRDAEWVTQRKADIVTALDQYVFDAEKVDVCGSDGVAFPYTPKRKAPDWLYPIILPDDGSEKVVEKVDMQ